MVGKSIGELKRLVVHGERPKQAVAKQKDLKATTAENGVAEPYSLASLSEMHTSYSQSAISNCFLPPTRSYQRSNSIKRCKAASNFSSTCKSWKVEDNTGLSVGLKDNKL